MNEALKDLFPTLLGKEMAHLTLKIDEENGTSLKSEKPMNVK